MWSVTSSLLISRQLRSGRCLVNPDDKVIIGYLHPGTVDGAFVRSLINLIWYDRMHNNRLWDGGGLCELLAGSNLSAPRNRLAKDFLEHDGANWLLMVDTDMTFPPNALDRLIERADPKERPIVGGLCFGFDDPDRRGHHAPTLYGIAEDENGNARIARLDSEIPVDVMFQVAGTGAAFLLVHRSVFERFNEFIKSPEDSPNKGAFNEIFPYFQETSYFGGPVGEDLTFCIRAGFLGFPVYVDTGLHIGHIKSGALDINTYMMQCQAEKEVTSVGQ